MAITDSTTTLDTTWVEKSFVEFTAGTLSNEAAMVTEVSTKLKRGTLSATTSPTETAVKRWLVRAKEEIAQKKGFSFKRRFASTTLTAGDYRISLPPDWDGGKMRLRDITNKKELFPWPNHIFDIKFPDLSAEASNAQYVYTIKNLEVWIAPPAQGTPELEIEYERSGDDNTPGDYAWIPEIERFRCCDYALAEAFESLEALEKSQYYRAKFEVGLENSKKADARRKWKDLGYRVQSILEREDMRLYQGIRR